MVKTNNVIYGLHKIYKSVRLAVIREQLYLEKKPGNLCSNIAVAIIEDYWIDKLCGPHSTELLENVTTLVFIESWLLILL